MRSTRRAVTWIIELTLVVTALVGGLGREASEVPAVTGSAALQGHLAAALALFDEHGLPQPDLAEVRFDSTDPRCEGRYGLYDGTSRSVLLCFDADTMILGSDETLHRREQRVLLHELAHAWTETHTGTDQREQFMGVHGVERWNDLGDRWHTRGTEIAAETFVWVLTDGANTPRSLASVDETLLRQGFAVLTDQ